MVEIEDFQSLRPGPLKSGVRRQSPNFRLDRFGGIRRSQQVVYVISHQGIASLKRECDRLAVRTFPIPTLRIVREGWGTLRVACAGEIQSLGHPGRVGSSAGLLLEEREKGRTLDASKTRHFRRPR